MQLWRYLKDVRAIGRSELFDRTYYSSKYGVPKYLAAAHFARKEHREYSPSPVFSPQRYYDEYPDVRAADANALAHYIRHGQKEGRIYKSENECELYDYFFTQVLFNIKFYADTYMSEEEKRAVNPIEHYSEKGWRLGYLPNPYFDLDAFHERYPECGIDPLLYCLKYRVPEIFVTEPLNLIKLGYQEELYKSYVHMLKQDSEFEKLYPNASSCEKLIWFWAMDQDIVYGGVMSMCGMYDISRRLSSVHGCEVIASTLPRARGYFSGYTLFDNDMPVFRYDQVVYHFPNVKEVIIMVPEMYIREVYDYLFHNIDSYLTRIPNRHLNILNQNIKQMPYNFEVDRLKRYFTKVTQTTAHQSYTTQYYRDLFGIPTHQIIPPIRREIVVTPYENKEEIFLYSPDEHPCKAAVLQRLREEFPSMKFIEVRDIPFRDYLKLISKAKWVMSFGEGLDGYYAEPYSAGGVSFTVWNNEFFTEKYKGLTTILNSYEEAVDTLPALMRSLDNKEAYEKVREEVTKVLHSDYVSEQRTPESMMNDFFCGNYDFK